jgi:hypothetical protein
VRTCSDGGEIEGRSGGGGMRSMLGDELGGWIASLERG